MPNCKLATPAKRDLVGILDYLLKYAGPRVALDVESKLAATFRMLAQNPGVGHVRRDLTSKPVLFIPVSRYMVVYRVDGTQVVVVAIFDGSRDIRSALERRSF